MVILLRKSQRIIDYSSNENLLHVIQPTKLFHRQIISKYEHIGTILKRQNSHINLETQYMGFIYYFILS